MTHLLAAESVPRGCDRGRSASGAEPPRAACKAIPPHGPASRWWLETCSPPTFPRSRTGQFRVYGNLPYYITSPILHRLFDCAGRIASIHIVIQLEVAERIVAQPGCRDYGYLSTVCQFYTKPDDRDAPAAGRVPSAPESDFRAGADDAAGRARFSGIARRGRKAIPRIYSIVLRTKTENPAE